MNILYDLAQAELKSKPKEEKIEGSLDSGRNSSNVRYFYTRAQIYKVSPETDLSNFLLE